MCYQRNGFEFYQGRQRIEGYLYTINANTIHHSSSSLLRSVVRRNTLHLISPLPNQRKAIFCFSPFYHQFFLQEKTMIFKGRIREALYFLFHHLLIFRKGSEE
jgi:hypothetical protein